LNIANRAKFTISGFPGNVWQVPAHNKDANLWISKVLGVVKTKAEAQAIVDAEVQAAQAAWDALSAEEQALRSRPADITLVE
jgi:alpha-D-ribose 1-methylphosphonate 5-triphosphate synthase subunit PhnG